MYVYSSASNTHVKVVSNGIKCSGYKYLNIIYIIYHNLAVCLCVYSQSAPALWYS